MPTTVAPSPAAPKARRTAELVAGARGEQRPLYRVSHWACYAYFLLAHRIRVIGATNVPRTGGVLLLANHQSFFDPILVGLPLPRECHYMARDSLFAHPAFARFIRAYNAYPIKRGRSDVAGIKETLRRLRGGGAGVTFPEGTRTIDGTIGPMQPGAIVVARRAGVPVVPVLILGAFEVWPRHRTLPRPGPILVVYDRPLSPDWIRRHDDQTCIDHVRERLIALMERYRRHPLLRGRLRPLPRRASQPRE